MAIGCAVERADVFAPVTQWQNGLHAWSNPLLARSWKECRPLPSSYHHEASVWMMEREKEWERERERMVPSLRYSVGAILLVLLFSGRHSFSKYIQNIKEIDCIFRRVSLHHHHAVYSSPMCVDLRPTHLDGQKSSTSSLSLSLYRSIVPCIVLSPYRPIVYPIR